MTIAAIVKKCKINSGIEELVIYLRVAKAVGATLLTEREHVKISDKEGTYLKVSIPSYLLSVDLFPASIEELVI